MNFPLSLIVRTSFVLFFSGSFLVGQAPEKLRDPEFLVEQYNQLVAKHNALIEKTRTIILEQKNSPL